MMLTPFTIHHAHLQAAPDTTPGIHTALFCMSVFFLLKQSYVLLGYLSLTELYGVLIREARQIEAKARYFDHCLAIHVN